MLYLNVCNGENSRPAVPGRLWDVEKFTRRCLLRNQHQSFSLVYVKFLLTKLNHRLRVPFFIGLRLLPDQRGT
jgi:hypothetical protein